MNAVINETQLWFCETCDKTFKIESKSKHTNSKSHKHKEKYETVVKEHEFNKPDIDSVNYILNDTIKDLRKKIIFIHSIIDVFMISKLQILRITKKLF